MLFGDGPIAERDRQGEDAGCDREREFEFVGGIEANDQKTGGAVVIRGIRRTNHAGYAVLRLLLRDVRT